MENVRKTGLELGGGEDAADERISHSGRSEDAGGGQEDPRLFYFRALLDGDRFFGGGRRS